MEWREVNRTEILKDLSEIKLNYLRINQKKNQFTQKFSKNNKVISKSLIQTPVLESSQEGKQADL